MKRTISIIFVLCMAIFAFVSCNVNGAQHPIVGHNYGSTDGKIIFYFASDNTVKNTIKSNGETLIIRDLTYKIISNQIEIYCGNTDFWKESARGKLFVTFSYNSKDNSLYSVDYGTIYCLD